MRSTRFWSRQHRLLLAFHVRAGLSIVAVLLKGGVGRGHEFISQTAPHFLFASVILLTVWMIGTRVVFAIPVNPPANWIFRMTQAREAQDYSRALRLPLLLIGLAPAWLAAAAVFFSSWPWQHAAAHLAVLGLWRVLVSLLCFRGFHKIPFTCSYLPGNRTSTWAFSLLSGSFF